MPGQWYSPRRSLESIWARPCPDVNTLAWIAALDDPATVDAAQAALRLPASQRPEAPAVTAAREAVAAEQAAAAERAASGVIFGDDGFFE